MGEAGRLFVVPAVPGRSELKVGIRMRSMSGVTRGVLCVAIAAVIAAVALTQSSDKLHAEASVIGTWPYQMRAAPSNLGRPA